MWRGHPAARSGLRRIAVTLVIALAPVSVAGILRANGRGTGMPYWVWLTLSLVLVVIVLAVDVLRRALTDYVVTTHRIRVRQGMLWRRERDVPVQGVEGVTVGQSRVQRLLGVGDIDFALAEPAAIRFEVGGMEFAVRNLTFQGVARPHAVLARLAATNGVAAPRSVS